MPAKRRWWLALMLGPTAGCDEPTPAVPAPAPSPAASSATRPPAAAASSDAKLTCLRLPAPRALPSRPRGSACRFSKDGALRPVLAVVVGAEMQFIDSRGARRVVYRFGKQAPYDRWRPVRARVIARGEFITGLVQLEPRSAAPSPARGRADAHAEPPFAFEVAIVTTSGKLAYFERHHRFRSPGEQSLRLVGNAAGLVGFEMRSGEYSELRVISAEHGGFVSIDALAPRADPGLDGTFDVLDRRKGGAARYQPCIGRVTPLRGRAAPLPALPSAGPGASSDGACRASWRRAALAVTAADGQSHRFDFSETPESARTRAAAWVP